MIVWKILAAASWVTLAVGLVWTGKVSLESAPPGPPLETVTVELTGEGRAELEAARDGEVELNLVARSPDQYDTEAFQSWLGERETPLRCEVHIAGDGEPFTWTVEGDDLRLAGSFVLEDEDDLLVLARTRVPVREGVRYTITARAVTADRFFLDHRPALLTGRKDEAPIELPVRDKRPGLVLLAGAAGAFIHLFGVWIRLMVPWRDALPPEGEEIPATA